MACLQSLNVGEQHGATPGSDAAVDGEVVWGGAADAAPGLLDPVGHNASSPNSAQQAIGAPQQVQVPLKTPRHADRPAPIATLRGAHVRLDLDGEMVGAYMRDAIERGGYRAALEYYSSDESKKSDTLGCRLRTTG